MEETLTREIAEQLATLRGKGKLSKYSRLDAGAAEALSKQNSDLLLNGLSEISAADAAILANGSGHSLSLDGLKSIDSKVAAALTKHEGAIELNGLEYINDAVALILSRHRNVSLRGLRATGKTPGYQALHQSLSNCPNLYMDRLEVLEEDFALWIHMSSEASIYLKSVKTLSVPSARHLGQTDQWLALDGIATMNREIATQLSAYTGPKLELNGLREITPEVALILSEVKSDLSLNGLKSIDLDTANALAKHRRNLSLAGVTELAPDAAVALAKHKGKSVKLSGLKTVSEDSALALIAVGPSTLSLQKVRYLSESVAKTLALFNGTLQLSGLKSISIPVATCLAKHKNELLLDGVSELDEGAAKQLAKHAGKNLSLRRLKKIYVPTAVALSTYRGRLTLGVESIDVKVASALAKHKGDLLLNSLRLLDDASAAKLAASTSYVSLDAIKMLSDRAAWAFTKHKGGLSMEKLTKKAPSGNLGLVTLRMMLN